MHLLVAADAEYVVRDVAAALAGPGVSFTVVTEGRAVVDAVRQRVPDVAILDLQIGSMGGMAVTMDLRLDESAGALAPVKVLLLLDRVADVHLAKRCGANGYLIKPLNPLALRREVERIDAAPVSAVLGVATPESGEQVEAAAR